LCSLVGKRLARVLSWQPLRYLGKVSYGLYLYHYAVITIAGEFFEGWIGAVMGWPVSTIKAVKWILVVPGYVLLSAFSWRFLETPILSLKSRFQ
jgi:peptidoglycan/LPS O-acetylase OafA/YrhL